MGNYRVASWVVLSSKQLVFNVAQFGGGSMFQGNVSPASSVLKSKLSRKAEEGIELDTWLAYSLTLKMEAACSSEMLVCLRTTYHYNPEYLHFPVTYV
jgi:hypothetical protein